MTDGLVRKVESVLFGAGKRMPLAQIAQLCKISPEEATVALDELKREFEAKESSLRVVHDGDYWKLTIREAYAETVQRLVTQTEFSKTIMETLAVIAYKAPVLQSEVIRIRTNKAYDHLLEIEQTGFITRAKQGRSKLIKLAPKFFEYFDLPEDAARARFATVREKEREVSEHEEQRKQLLEQIKVQKERTSEGDEQQRKRDEEKLKELDEEISRIENLETYAVKETFTDEAPSPLETVKDTVGNLDVYETESKEGTHWGDFEVYVPPAKGEGEEGGGQEGEETPSGETAGETEEPTTEPNDETTTTTRAEVPGEGVDLEPLEHKEGKGMFTEGIPQDVQENINRKIDELLHPEPLTGEAQRDEKRSDEPDSEDSNETQEDSSEPEESQEQSIDEPSTGEAAESSEEREEKTKPVPSTPQKTSPPKKKNL